MKKVIISVIFISLIAAMSGCTLYHKPEFRGRIIDAETKAPIESAVAVVMYYKQPLIGSPGGPNAYVFEAKETLTDGRGEFYFPSLTSMNVFTRDMGTHFIFYKPGFMAVSERVYYVGIPGGGIAMEEYFSTDVIGKEVEIEMMNAPAGKFVKWKGPLGIVELKKGESYPSTPAAYRSNKLPILFKAINEERRIRGHRGDVK